MSYKITNPTIRIILHLLFFLTGTAYILAGQLDISFLRYFKVVPLLILILLILPTNANHTNSKLIVGILGGLGGDLVLEY